MTRVAALLLFCLAALTLASCTADSASPPSAPEPWPIEARIYPRAFITTHQGPHAYFRQLPKP